MGTLPSQSFKEVYPFTVLGDGLIGKKMIAHRLRLLGKTPVPVPHFQFAKTIEQAREIADKMRPYNKMILILRNEEVVQWDPPSSS